jgi:fido (protein-threonine AMPylation protein)
MEFITIKEASEKWRISGQRVRKLCTEGRVPDAYQNNGTWYIPENAKKPPRKPREDKPKVEAPASSLVRKLRREKTKKIYHGLYDYIQVNLAYSSGRMASNRLMRKQLIEVFSTRKVRVGFEPIKIDDLIEATNHFICVDHIIDTATQSLTQSYIKRLHYLLLYGTFTERKGKCKVGVYRSNLYKINGEYLTEPKGISQAMSKLLSEYEAKAEICIQDILDFHVRFERIHPFDDANGRLGRLLMFKECIRHSIAPFIINDKQRAQYYEGISLWDYDNDVLFNVCYDAQSRFVAEMDSQALLEEQHRQLLRMGFFSGHHIPTDEEE